MLDIFGKITTGHAFVGMLVTGFLRKFLEPGLHIMLGHDFPIANRFKINHSLDTLGAIDGRLFDFNPQIFLGPHHCDPELTLHNYFSGGGPHAFHRMRGIPFRQYIGKIKIHVFFQGLKFLKFLANAADYKFWSGCACGYAHGSKIIKFLRFYVLRGFNMKSRSVVRRSQFG